VTKKNALSLVEVRAVKHLPMGVLAELADGRRGIIRTREMSIDADDQTDWRKIYPVGWKGSALLLPLAKDRSLELSLRLVQVDAWSEFVAKADKKKIFEGIVAGVVVYGVFVEIAEGVTGLLHRSCLPAWVANQPLDLFWPGDKVHVQIREVDITQRRLGLELVPSWLKNSPLIKMGEAFALPHQTKLSQFLQADLPTHHILLVEDHLEQRAMISGWLQKIGQRVDEAESARTALDVLAQSPPDIALVDVGLPGDMDGIGLANQILDQWPLTRVINATDWICADARSAELEALRLRGAEFIEKPLLPDDLIQILKAPPRLTSAETCRGFDLISSSDSLGTRAAVSIRALVSECCTTLGFDLCLLFAFDPTRRIVAIAEQAGTQSINTHAVASLVFSPVRDVAEDRKTLSQNEVSRQDEDYFRYLLDLYPRLASCIGMPVPGQLGARYALFVMDKMPRAITREQELYVRAMALALGGALEQKFFQEHAILMQRTALIGQLTKSMVHEINNLVGPMASRLEHLKTNLSKSQKNVLSLDADEKQKRGMVEEIDELYIQARTLSGITRTFGRITAKAHDEVLRMDQIVQETINLLKEPAARAHVTLLFIPPDDMPIVRSQSAALQQVILNLTLNAIQQIQELRPDQGGCVCVHIQTPERMDANHAFAVVVEDNGPGIHHSLWEKIFEIGFSTRPEGSGIGLYISRSLIEQIGGRLFVAESFILGGTKFVFEIPANFH
jgi:signal transduction histidine kinase/ActR/RegA family two-component response regulator